MTERTPIYLDYAATTPVDPAVIEAMIACLGADADFGNAASVTHPFGHRAAARIERAREQVASLLNTDVQEIVFTSGATESNNLAILGVARANADRGRHLITSRTEHKAVLDPCKRLEKEGFSVTYLTPARSGLIDPEAVRAALRPDTVLVSVMFANNEIGVVQDIGAIGAICRERGVPLHTDAAQAVGKIALSVHELPIDLLSFTAHKIYGPKGAGALYVSKRVRPLLQPINFGGGQERGLRPGTLATHQIVGLGAACGLAKELQPAEAVRLASLRERLWEGLKDLEGVYLNGEGAPHLPGILNVSFSGVEGESLVAGLAEVAVSTGSACNSATAEPSYVLRALGRGTQLAQSSLRFSVGRLTTVADVDVAIKAVRREIERLRALSPAMDRREIPHGIAGLPPCAGVFPVGVGPIFSGEAGRAGEETWVRFHLLVTGGAVKEARFQAYGCPHTVSVASWLASSLPGRRRENLLPGAPPDWARELGIPVERLGRLLVVEDALKACLRHWAAGE